MSKLHGSSPYLGTVLSLVGFWVRNAAEFGYNRICRLNRQGTAVTRNDKNRAPRRMTVDAKKSAERAGDAPVAPGSDQEKTMSPALQGHIGRQVRAMFDEVAEEPVPEHLLRLLKDLDQSGEN